MGWQTATSVSEEPAISVQPSEQKKDDGGTTLFQNTGNKAPDYMVSTQKTSILILHILHVKE
jgi:hypothetical protein